MWKAQLNMKLEDFLLIISTAIATTAAAQLPTDPRFQGFPPYLQQYEALAMLQQRFPQLQQEMCGDKGQACIQYRVIESVGVESLAAGQIVEVQYMAPTSGRVIFSFRAANGDYIFNAGTRINWRSLTNQFILNSYTNGCWLSSYQSVEGFPFTYPPAPTMIAVQIIVNATEFIVSVNDVTLASYTFRGSLTPDKVVKVECALDDNNASIRGKVEKIAVSF